MYNAFVDYIQGVELKLTRIFSSNSNKLGLNLFVRLLTSFFLLLLPLFAHAVDISKNIIITSGVEFDSNPALAEKDKDSVWIYSLLPRLQLDAADEVNRWYLDAALLVRRHSNETVLTDREDPTVILGWDRLYEAGFFGIKADYSETSSRTAELASTGVFVDKEGKQTTKVLAAKWQHELSPRWTVLTEGGHTDAKFDGTTGLGSYKVDDIGSKLTYAYTEVLDTYVKVGYAHLNPDSDFDNTDLVRVLLGADYQVSEGFNLGARAGVYKLSGQQTDTAWEGGVRAEYAVERMTYAAELNRELGTAGVGGFQKADSVKLSWLFDISERDKAGADFSLTKNKKDDDIGFGKVDYLQVGAFFERQLSDNWEGRVYILHKETESPGIQSEANIIGAALVYDTLSF